MTTPVDPEMCTKTGRLMTEWFENTEYTEDELRQMGAEKFGASEYPTGTFEELSEEERDLQKRIHGFVTARKNKKWRKGMTQQEVAHRMNEATKMVSPDNFKFLDDQTRERTGLEINPLWMMECLIRSGVLSPREQVQALKELATYTHSKSPMISHSTNVQMKPEDWLLELAKDEYKVIGEDVPMDQPKQPIEDGTHKAYEKRKEKRTGELNAFVHYRDEELRDLEAEIDMEWVEDD